MLAEKLRAKNGDSFSVSGKKKERAFAEEIGKIENSFFKLILRQKKKTLAEIFEPKLKNSFPFRGKK